MYPPRNPVQCECGNLKGHKFKSPDTGLFICRACNERYENGSQLTYLDDLERNHRANVEAKRRKVNAKAKIKRDNKKAGIVVYLDKEFDTPEFRAKQTTFPARVKQLREKATPSEIRVKQLLDGLKIDYIFQKAFIAYEYYCIVDFYIPKVKMCLEIDGGYHSTPEQVKKDNYRDVYLTEKRGFKVCRILNEDADKMTADELRSKLNDI